MEFTVDQKDQLLETFNSNPSGAFIFITGYEPVKGEGEVANYQLQSGISYDNIKQRSIKMLEKIKAGEDIQTLHVECQTWKKPDGTFTNRKAKDRTLVKHQADYSWDDKDFQDACEELMQGLTDPKKTSQPFDKEANVCGVNTTLIAMQNTSARVVAFPFAANVPRRRNLEIISVFSVPWFSPSQRWGLH